jgi:hypothetical protein
MVSAEATGVARALVRPALGADPGIPTCRGLAYGDGGAM